MTSSPEEEKEAPAECVSSAESCPCPDNPELSAAQLITVSEEEWQRLKSEAAEFKDKYLRLLAEMENTRKRLVRERQEISLFSNDSRSIQRCPRTAWSQIDVRGRSRI